MTKTPLLSICIATYNRASFIGETLDSIIGQEASRNVEIIIVDGGSSDGSQAIVKAYIKQHPNIVLKQLCAPGGIDKDFDIAVTCASGQYCWLLSDDDPLYPQSIEKVIDVLKNERPSLVIANASIYDNMMKKKLSDSQLPTLQDTRFEGNNTDELFNYVGNYFTFIGCVIVRRSIWGNRDRATYYGSEFIHIGVIFQKLLPSYILTINQPLIKIRLGNAKWVKRSFFIWAVKWPKLINQFDTLSIATKIKFADPSLANKMVYQLIQRGKNSYTKDIFNRHVSSTGIRRLTAYAISRLPVLLVNYLVTALFSIQSRKYSISLYELSIIRKSLSRDKE